MDSVVLDMLLGQMPIPKEVLASLKERMEAKEFAAINLDTAGRTLSLPKDMDIPTAIKFLKKRHEELENEAIIVEKIDAFPFDAAYSFSLVVQDLFGFSGHESSTVETPFGNFKYAPQFIGVEVERGKVVQVPWGDLSLPGIAGTFSMGFDIKDGNRVIFKITVRTKGRDKERAHQVIDAVREKLKTHSIYRGKAIRVTFRDSEGDEVFFDPSVAPTFMDLADNDPIFTASTEAQVASEILDPIRHCERLKAVGRNARRTVLLEGDFGTGKTLTACQTARVCVENKWTFLYVSDCEDLDKALTLAQQYAPAVVFTEDVDRVMSGKRDNRADALSYTLDGVDSKNRDVMVVLTTNDPTKIQKLMLRPGRIDSIISIEKPDMDTTWRLMVAIAKGNLLGARAEFEVAIEPMVGCNAAFIAEVMKKAEFRAIMRDADYQITPQDVALAVALMQNHVTLMNAGAKPVAEPIALTNLLVQIPEGMLVPARTEDDEE